MSDTGGQAATEAAYAILKDLPSARYETTDVVTISMAIAAAIEARLAWRPEPLADPLRVALIPHGQWSCGCSSRECAVRWDTFRDGSPTNPGAAVRVTCLQHALVADVDISEADRSLTRARALAMAKLDALHAEQCR